MFKFQNKLEQWKRNTHNISSHEKLLTHQLGEAFDRLAHYNSTRQLVRSELYKGLETQIRQVTNGVEYGFHNDEKNCKPKPFYRVVFWNLEGKVSYESLLTLMKTHPIISRADIFCFAHSEIGMTRSENRNIIRSLALEKSFNYVSSCSYLHLNRFMDSPDKPNQLGIVGLSILTKYPLSHFRLIPIRNSFDPMKSVDKKIGCEKALIADLTLGTQKLMLVVLQLDQYSSPKDRAQQLDGILNELTEEEKKRPILVASDLQTTTYNTKTNARFTLNLINKIFRGFEYIAKEHHLNPQLFFDKAVFEKLAKHDFHYKDLNEMGKLSSQKPIVAFLQKTKWGHKVYTLLLKVLTTLFFSHHDLMSSRTDWFAGNAFIQVPLEPNAEKPRVVENYSLADSEILTHTPLVLDFTIQEHQ